MALNQNQAALTANDALAQGRGGLLCGLNLGPAGPANAGTASARTLSRETSATACLVALGRPLSPQATRDLVNPRIVSGRWVVKLPEFVGTADALIRRRVARPNLKAQTAAKTEAAV